MNNQLIKLQSVIEILDKNDETVLIGGLTEAQLKLGVYFDHQGSRYSAYFMHVRTRIFICFTRNLTLSDVQYVARF